MIEPLITFLFFNIKLYQIWVIYLEVEASKISKYPTYRTDDTQVCPGYWHSGNNSRGINKRVQTGVGAAESKTKEMAAVVIGLALLLARHSCCRAFQLLIAPSSPQTSCSGLPPQLTRYAQTIAYVLAWNRTSIIGSQVRRKEKGIASASLLLFDAAFSLHTQRLTVQKIWPN